VTAYDWDFPDTTTAAITTLMSRALFGDDLSPEHRVQRIADLAAGASICVSIVADWHAETLWRSGLVRARLAGRAEQVFLAAVDRRQLVAALRTAVNE
jgi:hypothetical protein